MSKTKKSNPSSGRLVEIELPLEGTNTKLNINATTTAQQVHDIIIKRPFYENTAYAFSLAPSNSRKHPLEPEAQLASQSSSKFTLIITGISATVRVEQKGIDEVFQFGSDYTVKECLAFIEHCDCVGAKFTNSNLKDSSLASLHDLYLVKEANSLSNSYSSNDGIRMQHDKLLSSYRLKYGDALVYSRSRNIPNFWTNPATENDVTLEITEAGTRKTETMTFPLDTTYFEIIGQFLKKAGIVESSWFYGMYLTLENDKKCSYYLHPDWTLRTYNHASPAKLICKKRLLPKRQWFGVDPQTLPLMKDPDNGLCVPQVLLILKDLLELLNGYESEGIFRKAGLESEMVTLKSQMNDGIPFFCNNQHTIATMLKRWFKALPKRLLVDVDRGDETDEFYLRYPTFLSPFYTILMSWLLDLLINVVKHKETNLMDPKNCAIVWGPGMTGSDESTAASSPLDMAGFSDTQYGINVILANVSNLFENDKRPYGVADRSGSGCTAKCISDHSKENDGELELKAGDVVVIIDNSNFEWAFVNHDGKYGFVAKNYIKQSNSKSLQRVPSSPSVGQAALVSSDPRRATYNPVNTKKPSGNINEMLTTKVTSSGQARPPVPRRSNN